MRNYIIIFVLFALTASCKQKLEKEEQPNIVWITSEDNSKHYMSLFDENGVSTPNVQGLAEEGVTFTNTFSNSSVCSAARSTLISGCYGPRTGSHYHRKIKSVPMPEGIEMFPAYLKQAGYYTSNNAKEDYNIIKSDSVWDESSKQASWRNRKDGQPFFHVQNIYITHEGPLHFTKEEMDSVENNNDYKFVMPNHPNTEIFKYTNARYRDNIQKMDNQVGGIIAELKNDSLLENTIVFYFGDHGGVLPGSKGYLFETGLHVPLVVYVPEKFKHLLGYEKGSRANGFVSFVDFGATVLNLVGIESPDLIDGKPFLGNGVSVEEVEQRDETFGYTDRMDEKYDMVRSYRKGKYKYIRNFQPYNFNGIMNNYRYKQLAYQEWKKMFKEGKLDSVQSQFFVSKPVEALYDIESDPYETNNLAENKEYLTELIDLRERLSSKMKSMPDLSIYPEHYLIKNAFNNPVAFGKEHKEDIEKLIDIANLSLYNYEDVKEELESNLKSEKPWERYWSLNSCMAFGKAANEFAEIIKQISVSDPELLNRVRAAEFLAITLHSSPVNVVANALYTTNDKVEALEILNSIVLLQDGNLKYQFSIEVENLQKEVVEDPLVKERLNYLTIL